MGRIPWISASLPGQKKTVAIRPCRSAVTQIGSPSYQRPALTSSRIESEKSAWKRSSHIVLLTMPWCSG